MIRSRLCAKEFRRGPMPELYAGTPPLEALKAILSLVAENSSGQSLLHVDVSRAYFHAKARRTVLVEVPEEDLGDGEQHGEFVWVLEKSMYGTRDAARNWEIQLLRSRSFVTTLQRRTRSRPTSSIRRR